MLRLGILCVTCVVVPTHAQNILLENPRVLISRWTAVQVVNAVPSPRDRVWVQLEPSNSQRAVWVAAGQRPVLPEGKRREWVCVELKESASAAAQHQRPDLDPLKVVANQYRLVFENHRVRVLAVHSEPGQVATMHEHIWQRALIYHTRFLARVASSDGSVRTVDRPAGSASWNLAARHEETNLSDNTFRATVVDVF